MTAMVKGIEILTAKREVWLQAPPQPNYAAIITKVEENIFWINLPQEGNQVLVLLEKQRVMVGVSLRMGFYVSETTVEAVGRDNNRFFYGLTIPEEFIMLKERRFLRANYSTNVMFSYNDQTVRTTMVNFSAGGIMVYLTSELDNLLKLSVNPILHLNLDGAQFQLPVRTAWRKNYGNIPFVGFEFINLPNDLQETLAELAFRYFK